MIPNTHLKLDIPLDCQNFNDDRLCVCKRKKDITYYAAPIFTSNLNLVIILLENMKEDM